MWDTELSYTVLLYISTNVTHFYITKSLNSYHMVCIMLSQFKITLPFLDSVAGTWHQGNALERVTPAPTGRFLGCESASGFMYS